MYQPHFVQAINIQHDKEIHRNKDECHKHTNSKLLFPYFSLECVCDNGEFAVSNKAVLRRKINDTFSSEVATDSKEETKRII